MLRSNPAERLDPAVPTTRARARVLYAYREGKRVTRRALTEIADQFQYWLKNRSEKWGAPLVEAPEEGRRDDFVHQYLRGCPSDRVAVILKAREPARIRVAIGGEKNNSRD